MRHPGGSGHHPDPRKSRGIPFGSARRPVSTPGASPPAASWTGPAWQPVGDPAEPLGGAGQRLRRRGHRLGGERELGGGGLELLGRGERDVEPAARVAQLGQLRVRLLRDLEQRGRAGVQRGQRLGGDERVLEDLLRVVDAGDQAPLELRQLTRGQRDLVQVVERPQHEPRTGEQRADHGVQRSPDGVTVSSWLQPRRDWPAR